MQAATIDDLFDLSPAASRIRHSSNFSFAWQFFLVDQCVLDAATDRRSIFDLVIADRNLHSFLRDSFNPMYHASFSIDPLHEHCKLAVANDEFVDVMAGAANNRLGAYTQNKHPPTKAERSEIHDLFSSLGAFTAYATRAGSNSRCKICKTDPWNHCFTNWFYSIGFDYCFMVTWPKQDAFWIGCLTDTD